jgi:guanylate kinase
VTPRVVVLAAPSGGGKTTIARELVRRRPERFGYSVSATTRKPRPGERDGEAYHFLTRDEFERRVRAGAFLESQAYAQERYGTLRSEVERVLGTGRHVLLDIEVQGARQVRRAYPAPASVGIFVIPPSPGVLIDRLRRRRTESEREMRERLAIAVGEVAAARDDAREGKVFDHVVINDDLDATVERVAELIDHPEGAAPRAAELSDRLAQFVAELEHAGATSKPTAKRSG